MPPKKPTKKLTAAQIIEKLMGADQLGHVGYVVVAAELAGKDPLEALLRELRINDLPPKA